LDDKHLQRMFRSLGEDYWLCYEKASLSRAEAAPDQSEYIYKGELGGESGYNGVNERVTGDITLRVAREGTGGRWSIRYIRIKQRENKK